MKNWLVTAHGWWIETAKKAGIDLDRLRPDMHRWRNGLPGPRRSAWKSPPCCPGSPRSCSTARGPGAAHTSNMPPATRCTSRPNSSASMKPRKVAACGGTAWNGSRRFLNNRQARILLVFKVSRLLRTGYKSFQFVNEEVVEEGLAGRQHQPGNRHSRREDLEGPDVSCTA